MKEKSQYIEKNYLFKKKCQVCTYHSQYGNTPLYQFYNPKMIMIFGVCFMTSDFKMKVSMI